VIFYWITDSYRKQKTQRNKKAYLIGLEHLFLKRETTSTDQLRSLKVW